MAVFGAGIAGLTVAHELAGLGHRVSLFECNADTGGFFRSARRPADRGMPSEYSWHGFGPWYHNTFDLLKRIPFDEDASLYQKALSRPIDFGIFPEQGQAAFYDRGWLSIPAMFRLSWFDFWKASWLMLKTWVSDRRSAELYAGQNAAEAWSTWLPEVGLRTWRSCFGPWVGSDWTKVSRHQVGHFFCRQLTTRPAHPHPADEDGPEWKQGAGDGWLLLRGPSNEYWFDRWVAYLQAAGVEVFCSQSLHSFVFEEGRIQAAMLASGEQVRADDYVLATNPFAAAEIVARTPALERLQPMCRLKALVAEGPHTQISFRIAFARPLAFPRQRMAVVLADSEFNITLFAEEQVWREEVPLGERVCSLWTGTTCTGDVPGRLFGLTAGQCSRQQYEEEITAQIFACQSLQALIREANGGKSLENFPIERIEVWHEWQFTADGVKPVQPKWVNTTATQPHLPDQITQVPNLLMAGAHTRTEMDLWSIEAAVESGRRAARAIDPRVPLLAQYKPGWLRLLNRLDNLCYRLGCPHLFDVILGLGLACLLGWFISLPFGYE